MLIAQVLPQFPPTSMLWNRSREGNMWNRAAGYQSWITGVIFETSGKV